MGRSPKWGDGGEGWVDLVQVGGGREVKAGRTSSFGKRSSHRMTVNIDYKKLVGVQMLGTLVAERQDKGVWAKSKVPRNLMLL